MPNETPLKDWSQDYGGHFPGSRKVHVEDGDIRVPMREITLSKGESPLRVYDTSGPLGQDPKIGLPPLREQWIVDRGGFEKNV